MQNNASQNPTPRTRQASTSAQYIAKEYKVIALRECPLPETLHYCATPNDASAYWRLHVATNPYYDPEIECAAVLFLNRKHRVKGHQFLSMGTVNSTMVHPREVFRAAIVACAAGIVLMHNHPSGDPSPSPADIKITRELVEAGKLLGIELIDHVVIGNPNQASLRDMGYCIG
ncbi:MAG TPA: JAB domain-containing protein [Opitutales bacterium]|nr:JAB domain-containing protein [Opitutales bacterium]